MAGFFSTLLGASADPSGFPPPPESDFWYSDPGGYGGPRTHSGKLISAETAMRISTVHACVNLLAKSVATLPLSMYKYDPLTGDKTAAPNHPLNELLEYQPNSWQTAFDFRAMMMMHLALRGNAYAEIIPGPRGAVNSLEPFHPDTVQVERLSDGSLRYTVTNGSGVLRRLVQDEVFHIRAPITNGLVGISPVAYAKETMGLTLAAEEHGSRMFSNGARPNGVIQLPGSLKKDEFDRFKQSLNTQYGGGANAGKTMVLENGATWNTISLKADEMQFLETRLYQVEEIARWFDVPLIMLHSQSKTTSWGSGIEQILGAYVRNTLNPWLTAWQQAIRRDLILAPQLYKAEFDVSALQRGDMTAQANFFSKLVLAGILTANEGRASLGYNAIPGLSEPYPPPGSAVAPDQGGGGDAGSSGGNPPSQNAMSRWNLLSSLWATDPAPDKGQSSPT